MSEKPPPTVEVHDLVHTHPGESEPLLSGVDLTIAEGEMVAIAGPSGCGKTTLLNLLAGLITPDRGTVRVRGHEITPLSPSARARWRGQVVGYAYQDARLLPQLDVVTNVAWPLLFGDRTRREALGRAESLLGRLHLAPLAAHRPETLSGGEQRRVALARALAANPPVLLVDEPTANLDAEAAEEVVGLIARAREEFQTTILLVTHSPEAQAHCDRRLTLRSGRLHAEAA